MTYQDIIASIPHSFLELPAKAVFLREGEVDDRYFFIEEGAVRLCFDQDGKEITLNFFFEGEGVAAMESAILGHIHLLSQNYGIISRKHRHIRLSHRPRGL